MDRTAIIELDQGWPTQNYEVVLEYVIMPQPGEISQFKIQLTRNMNYTQKIRNYQT